MDIIIAPATALDRPDWLDMRRLLWPATSEADHVREMDVMLRGTGPGVAEAVAWIARDRRQAALGFAEATQRPFANGCMTGPVAYLEGIWVSSEAQRRGVGRLLVGAVETWAAERNLAELASDALLDNQVSHHAHNAWGFEETERLVCYRKPVVPMSNGREAA